MGLKKGGVGGQMSYAWTLRSILRCWLANSTSSVMTSPTNNCFLDDEDCLVGVQLVGGFGKQSGVGGSKHLLPAKQGEPLLGVEEPD